MGILGDVGYWAFAILFLGIVAYGVWQHYQLDEDSFTSGHAILEMEEKCQCDLDMDCTDFFTQESAQTCYEHCLDVTGENTHEFSLSEDGIVCTEVFN